MFVNKLDDILNKYNTTYHSISKMKSFDVKSSTYIGFNPISADGEHTILHSWATYNSLGSRHTPKIECFFTPFQCFFGSIFIDYISNICLFMFT